MELRYRHPADEPSADAARPPDHRETPRDTPRQASRGPADTGQQTPDSSERSTVTRPQPADARPVKDNAGRYDADAEFKRGIPKPPGYLPDDTGRLSPRSTATADRHNELHHDPRSAQDRTDATPGPKDGRQPLDPGEAREGDGGDASRVLVDHPAIHHPGAATPLDRYGNVLHSLDGSRLPCLNGRPVREQASQGRIRDCGIVAALGAVAGHRPDDIAHRVREQPDGTYLVTLSETNRSDYGAVPTGRNIELRVTPEVPVNDEAPDNPACAQAAGGAAWCPVLEKAMAGVDQTWTTERRVAWWDSWTTLCAMDGAENSRSGPAPNGYVRLNQGSDAWDRAEVLTQLTGQEAVVRKFPSGLEEWRINRVLRAQLAEGKPVLVSSRPQEHDQEMLTHNLEPEHAYEVIGVEKGKILLRNPWNHKHPEPMETQEFALNMRPWYSTLT